MEALMSKLNLLEDKLLNIEQTQRECEGFSLSNLEADKPSAKVNEGNCTNNLDKFEQTIDGIGGKLDELTRSLQKDLKEKLDEIEKKIESVDDLVQNKLVEFEKSMKEMHQCMKALNNSSMISKVNVDDEQKGDFNQLREDAQLKILDQEKGFMKKYKEETPAKTPTLKGPYKSCRDIPSKQSGIYKIEIGPDQNISVYCEQIAFGGGWIVVQHRFNGEEDFDRYWIEYRDGFGSLDGEFWLGLEYLHQLTSTGKYELVIEMKDYEGTSRYARYDHFEIRSESEQYSLKLIEGWKGTAYNSLSSCRGAIFKTKDTASDKVYDLGWWDASNINGRYENNAESDMVMNWYDSRNKIYRPLACSRMMIRKVNDTATSEKIKPVSWK